MEDTLAKDATQNLSLGVTQSEFTDNHGNGATV